MVAKGGNTYKKKQYRKYKKRTYKSKASPRIPYRNPFSTSIQMADLKPEALKVRYQGYQKYLVSSVTSVGNVKSILRVPASFLGDPVPESGNWVADSLDQFYPTAGISNFFPRYNHYKVIGMQIQITVQPLDIDSTLTQRNNICVLARVPKINAFPSGVTNKSLEASRSLSVKQFGSYGGTGYIQCYNVMGYSPAKQLNLKDWQDSGLIRCTNVYDTPPTENTYFNVILAGSLDKANDPPSAIPHAQAIVTVKTSAILFHSEATVSNAPVGTML